MPKKRNEVVDIEVTVEDATTLAWKVTSHTTGKTAWVARSTAKLDTDSKPATLTLPTYIAEEKGLV